MAVRNPFEILEIPPSATLSQIREAYRRLVKECLWDRTKFVELNRAYEILTNPEKRQEFEASTGYKFAFTSTGSWWEDDEAKEESVSPTGDAKTVQTGAGSPTVQVGRRIESTQFTMPTLCAICQTNNSPLEVWCQECGFLLGSSVGEKVGSDRENRPLLTTLDGTQEFALREGESFVGREDADVLLADRTVSRRHARILVEEGRVRLEDLGSTNGTLVGGQPLPAGEVKELKDGEEVRFGGIKMTIAIPTLEAEEQDQEKTAQFDIELTQEISPVEVEEEPPPAPVGKLVWKGESDREVLLYPGTVKIGRRSSNDIALREDLYISGHHAQIVADEEGVGLIDLHSTNGTTVNGEKLTPEVRRPLQAGDEIGVGQQKIVFEAVGES